VILEENEVAVFIIE